MMRRGKPLGNLNWITKRFFLMTATDKETLNKIRDNIEHSRQIKVGEQE
jgi:hypothetical protein